MKTEVIQDMAGLAALRDEWRQLVEESVEDGLFLTWDWIAPWWNAYGGVLHGRPHVVAFRADDGALCGLAPLYASPGSSTGFAPRGEVLRFLGSGGDTSPDYLNLVARPGLERAVAEATFQHVAGADGLPWDALLLTDLPGDAPMTDELERALRRLRLVTGIHRQPHAVCPFVDLPETPDDLLGRQARKHRNTLRSSRQKLERDHGARFFLWADPAGPAIDLLAALHTRRFSAKGESHGFSSDAYLRFHRDVAERFRLRGLLRLYCLEADGQIVAMLYCFRFRDRIYHFQSGFDPDWSKAGVGGILMSLALEAAIAEGARRFDFLKGEYAYKDRWATGRRQTQRLVAGRLNPAGLHHMFRMVLRPTLGSLMRGALP